MKLIVRTASFECLGEILSFDISVIIDSSQDHGSFTFKPTQDLCVRFAMPEVGFVVESNLQNQIKDIQIALPNLQLSIELTECISNFVKKFDFKAV